MPTHRRSPPSVENRSRIGYGRRMRSKALALLLAAGLACDGSGDDVIAADPQGRVLALINLEVGELQDTALVGAPDGRSLVFVVQRGVITVDGIAYGQADESHLLGLSFSDSLQVLWVRDYGPAQELEVLGGRWSEPRATLVLSMGSLTISDQTIEAPAVLSIAIADGVVVEDQAIIDPAGDLELLGLGSSESGMALVGRLTRAQDEEGTPLQANRIEGWAARIDAGQTTLAWTRGFAAGDETAEFNGVGVDSLGNLIVQGHSRSFLDTAPEVSGTFLMKLGATLGDPIWIRAVSDSVRAAPLAITSTDDIAFPSRALDTDTDPEPRPLLFSVTGTNGAERYSQQLGDASEAEPFEPTFACATSTSGENEDEAVDTIVVAGEFSGSLQLGDESADVERISMFVINADAADGTPRFLRSSQSSVDVTVDYFACDESGATLGGGSFVGPADADPDRDVAKLFFLRLAP